MKILHIADYLPDLHEVAGGAEYATKRIIDEQIAAGIEVEVATLRIDRPRPKLPWSRHYEMRHIDPYAPRLAYAVKQLYYPRDPLARYSVREILAQSRPDLVHFHNLHFAGLGVIDSAVAYPSVMTIYDYWLFCPSFMLLTKTNELCRRGHGAHCVDCIGTRRLKALKPIKRVLFGSRPAVFAQHARKINCYTVLSEASREVLLRNGIPAAHIRVIPQYIWAEAAATPRTTAPEKGRLVYVGWVESRKGLHVIVEALAQLASEYPELHLEVLGMPANAEYKMQIDKLIADHKLADRVKFRGKLPRSALLSELRRAFLVTIPEQWENMSPVILTEAMAAGACVLASRVGGIRQFVKENRNGLLAERDQASEFAARMRWAMEHPDKVKAMGIAALERARVLFDPACITSAQVELYRELIDGHNTTVA